MASKAPNKRIDAAQVTLEKKKAELQKWQMHLNKLKAERMALKERQGVLSAIPTVVLKEAWCADYTQRTSGEVGTIEIPDEPDLMLVQPGAPDHTADHGVLVARAAQKPHQVYFNAAVLPGVQRHRPKYRLGTIERMYYTAGVADVVLASANSSAINLPINARSRLFNVPFQYMSCNSAAFQVGDEVVIWLTGGSWDTPMIIGFKREPRKCATPLLYLQYFKLDSGSAFGQVYQRASITTPWGKRVGDLYQDNLNSWVRPIGDGAGKPFFVGPSYGAWVGCISQSDIFIQSALGQSVRLDHPLWTTYPRARFRIVQYPFVDCDLIKEPSGRILLVFWKQNYIMQRLPGEPALPGDPPTGVPILDPFVHVFDFSAGIETGTLPLLASYDMGTSVDVMGTPYPSNEYLCSDGVQYFVTRPTTPEFTSLDVRRVSDGEIVASHALTVPGIYTTTADGGTLLICKHIGGSEWPPVNWTLERRDLITWQQLGSAQITLPGTNDYYPRHLTMIGNMAFWLLSDDGFLQAAQGWDGVTRRVHGVQLMLSNSGEQFVWDAPSPFQEAGAINARCDLMLGK